MDSVIALGTFDGVHLGHQQLIRQCLALAREQGMRPLIYTFANHPLEAFGRAPQLLTSDAARLGALSALCETVADPFDITYAAMQPGAFVQMLQQRFSMKGAVAGFNYTFGDKGRGTMALLRSLGRTQGFQVVEIPPYLYKGKPISSTRIRQCVMEGAMEDAAAMLGRAYAIQGRVVSGKALGHVLGFPTANLEVPCRFQVLPATGVYATSVTLPDGSRRPAVTNVGNNPTVGGTELTIEAHILDWQGDIYRQEITIAFLKWLRGDQRFPSKEALAAQIAKDVQTTRSLLPGYGKNA